MAFIPEYSTRFRLSLSVLLVMFCLMEVSNAQKLDRTEDRNMRWCVTGSSNDLVLSERIPCKSLSRYYSLYRNGGQAYSNGLTQQTEAEAEKLIREGQTLLQQGTAASYRQAIEKYEAAAKAYRVVGSGNKAALALSNAGYLHAAVGNKNKGLECYEQALALFQAVSDRGAECRTLFNIAAIHQSYGEPEKALDYYERGLPIARASHDQSREAGALHNIGILYATLREKRKALEYYEKALPLFRSVGNRDSEAAILIKIGQAYVAFGENRKAIEYFEQSLPLLRAQDNRLGEAVSLNHLGGIYVTLGDKHKALEYFERALPLVRANADRGLEAAILNNIGSICSAIGQQKKGLESHESALAIYQLAKDRKGEAETLNKIGLAYNALQERKKALEYFQRALVLFRETNNQAGEASAIYNTGRIYSALKDGKKAQEAYSQALKLFRAAGDDEGVAATLASMRLVDLDNKKRQIEQEVDLVLAARRNYDKASEAYSFYKIGETLDGLGENQKALEAYERALSLYRSGGDLDNEAALLFRIGWIYNRLGEKGKALEYYERALQIRKTTGNKQQEAALLGMISGYWFELGDRKKALEYCERELALLRTLKDRRSEARVLNKIGIYYGTLLDVENALKYFQQAAGISEELGNKNAELVALKNIGDVYKAIGNYKKALDYYQHSLRLAQEIKNTPYQLQSLQRLGDSYFESGESQAARQYYEQIVSLSQSKEDSLTKADDLVCVGVAWQALGRLDKAKDYLEKALSKYRVEKDPSGEGEMHIHLGKLNAAMGNNKRAEDYFEMVVPLLKKLSPRDVEANALSDQMLFWKERNNPRLAIFFGKQFVNFVQQVRLRIRIDNQELQKSLLVLVESRYRTLADLLISQARIAEAEQVLGMLKEEEYFQFIRRDDKVARELLKRANLNAAEESALRRYDEIADKITSLGSEYEALDRQRKQYPAGQFPQQTRFDELDRQLADAKESFRLFISAVKEEFGKKDERVAQVESGLQKDLKKWEENTVVVISTIVGDERLNLVVTTAATQRAHTVEIKAADLNKLIAGFRQALKDPNIDPRPTGQKLYDILIKPIEGDLQGAGAKTLLWSLDGALRYVPMAAIYDRGKGYLAEHYSNVLITLASRTSLGRVTAARSNLRGLGFGASKEYENFPRLEAVPEELRGIIRQQEQEPGVIMGKRLLDDEFTLKAFRDNLGRYQVVHIASHFNFHPGKDTDSYLLLGGGEKRKLTLQEIRNGNTLFNGVEQLTLSACDTATGSGGQGAEIESFGVVAKEQGAQTVMATLWPVADASTRDLMVEYYRQLQLSEKLTKAEALHRAQMKLLRGESQQIVTGAEVFPRTAKIVGDGTGSRMPEYKRDPNAPYAHLYYWAPFILIGNWR
jgi:CHAT domain-containing protein/Tfp pilus assembly protein PilF